MSMPQTELTVIDISTKSITVTKKNAPTGTTLEIALGPDPAERLTVEVPEGKVWDIGGQIRIAERNA